MSWYEAQAQARRDDEPNSFEEAQFFLHAIIKVSTQASAAVLLHRLYNAIQGHLRRRHHFSTSKSKFRATKIGGWNVAAGIRLPDLASRC